MPPSLSGHWQRPPQTPPASSQGPGLRVSQGPGLRLSSSSSVSKDLQPLPASASPSQTHHSSLLSSFTWTSGCSKHRNQPHPCVTGHPSAQPSSSVELSLPPQPPLPLPSNPPPRPCPAPPITSTGGGAGPSGNDLPVFLSWGCGPIPFLVSLMDL